jgi:hypothetical protein
MHLFVEAKLYVDINMTIMDVVGITTMLQIQGLYNTLKKGMKMDCSSVAYHLV